MKCIACGKEYNTNKKFCHECLIVQSKKKLTDQELIDFKQLKEAHIRSIDDLNNKLFQKDTKISFNCIQCGKTYTGRFRNIKAKTELLCHQCELEKNNLEKYGVKNVFQLDNTKSKIRETNKEKYGVESFLQTTEARDARRKYNTEYFIQLAHQRLDDYCSSIKFSSDLHRRIVDNNGVRHYQEIACICKVCSTEYTTTTHRFQRCPNCYKEDWLNGTSKLETLVYDYVKSIYSGIVIKNARGILSKKEIDIYLPSLRIGIEIDGDYWHGYHDIQTDFRSIQAHAGDKQKECQQLGIRLITIKECDYNARNGQIKNFLKDLICPRKRIYGRDCDFVELDTNIAKEFCDKYHVDGYRPGNYKCGLMYGNELVCVAVFGKHKKYENECMRLCYKTGIDITGGWAKIVKHFGKPFLHYINLMYFPGEDKTGAGYRFCKGAKILSRNTLEKTTQLYKYCESIDTNLTDYQNIVKNGFICVFDCGNDIRLYNI